VEGTISSRLNNLGVVIDVSDARRVHDLYLEALREAERFGDAKLVRFMRGNLVPTLWLLGEWDDALAGANALIAECESGIPFILEGPTRQFRGYIELARGSRERALVDFTRSLAIARGHDGDPESLVPALARYAWALLQVGRVSEARAAFAEAIPLLERYPFSRPWTVPEVALDLGETSAVRTIFASLPPSAGHRAMLAVLDGEFELAGELYTEAGIPLFEAEARLRAAERLFAAGRTPEGEIELEKALTFYRSCDATLFVERGEALLAQEATG
jgi:tetratricopeptide (TPR) repeat protein